MNKKEFKTLDEQLNIFKNKGLIINDENKVRDILFLENYFFINGYRHIFMKSSKDRTFVEGSTFDELYEMFLFDRNLRNILFKNLLIIENNLKSIISYELSKKYGYREKDYLNPSNFTNDNKEQRRVNDVINKMKRQIRVNGSRHTATLHYISNYGYVPLWILVKVLSFGLINELYGILKEEDKEYLANFYNIEKDDLEIYLALLANYRNLCAHEDVVFEHRSQRIISDNRFHLQLNIQKQNDEYVSGKNDIFSLIIIMKQMLTKENFNEMMGKIEELFVHFENNVKSIEINKLYKKMGFPENYKDILNME